MLEQSSRIEESKLESTNPDEFWDIVNQSTIYDIIPKSSKVIVLDIQLKVKDAFQILHSCGILYNQLVIFEIAVRDKRSFVVEF